MNAIDFLKKEHEQVKTMLKDISDKSHHYETKKKKFAILAHDLIRHENMEHEVWYPHFKNKLSSTVQHLLTEEKMAENAIAKLEAIKNESAWEAHFLKFKKDVEHHAKEEETELFPEVKAILSTEELSEIGKKMFHYKQVH